jgi:hypothetical protein
VDSAREKRHWQDCYWFHLQGGYNTVTMVKRTSKKCATTIAWRAVEGAGADKGVLAAVREVEDFWTHGPIEASQVEGARVRTRGTRKTRTNTDYELDVRVGEVLYRASVKGEGDPAVRCPEEGRVWVTQPCVVCGKDDKEEALLLCGTDDAGVEPELSGCNRSHHTHCVGLSVVPEDDWFCSLCERKRSTSEKVINTAPL